MNGENSVGRWIILVRQGSDEDAVDRLKMELKGKLRKEFFIGRNRILRAVMSSEESEQLYHDFNEEIESIEYDAQVRVASLTCGDEQSTSSTSWGIRSATSNTVDGGVPSTFRYNQSWGQDIDVYVLDSGVDCSHSELTNCEFGTITSEATTSDDIVGHGTHVAGTIAGQDQGISRSTNIISVKVMNDNGGGSVGDIAEGITWAIDQVKLKTRRAIIHMSLEAPKSAILDNSVNAASDEGIVVVTAAGNGGIDACNVSPGSAVESINVGNAGIKESPGGTFQYYISGTSNWGSCIDVFGPGEFITSAKSNTIDSESTLSGTSMAAPHVTGAVAAYLSDNPTASVQEAKNFVIGNSVIRSIADVGITTTKKFLNIPCDGMSGCCFIEAR